MPQRSSPCVRASLLRRITVSPSPAPADTSKVGGRAMHVFRWLGVRALRVSLSASRRSSGTLRMSGPLRPIAISEQLTQLVYELLDAHDDTARLAADMAGDPLWAIHLEYLRDLQRIGREALGSASA